MVGERKQFFVVCMEHVIEEKGIIGTWYCDHGV